MEVLAADALQRELCSIDAQFQMECSIRQGLEAKERESSIPSSGGLARFTVAEIKAYLEGQLFEGEHRRNHGLKDAIAELEDYEDGIEAVTELFVVRKLRGFNPRR